MKGERGWLVGESIAFSSLGDVRIGLCSILLKNNLECDISIDLGRHVTIEQK